MNKKIEETITPFINVPMRIKQDDGLENVIFFNYADLSYDDKADIADYYLDEEVTELVENGELIPIALLGLTDNPDSFAEQSHTGILLWDLRKDSGKNRILFLNINENGELLTIADSFSDLDIQSADAGTSESEVLDDIAVLQSPAYSTQWESLLDNYRQGKPQEALDIEEKLASLIPGYNLELMKMRALLLNEVGRNDEALTLAQDIVISAMGDAVELEFSGRIQLKAKSYDSALATAEEIFEWLGDDDNNRMRACAYAIKGIAQFHLGNKSEGEKNIKEAKSLFSMINIKYPEVVTLLK